LNTSTFGDGMATSGMAYDKTITYNLSGEFGFFATSGPVGFKLGVEVVKPRVLEGIVAKDANDTPVATIKSETQAIIPKLGLVFSLKRAEHSRLSLGILGGSAQVLMSNTYVLTTAGQTAYPGVADFTEEGKAIVTTYEAVLTYEHLFTDTTTIGFEVGYRSLNVTGLTHASDNTTFQGAVTKGSPVVNADGGARSFDLSGPFAGMAFYFYL
jgi:hypothetical protein